MTSGFCPEFYTLSVARITAIGTVYPGPPPSAIHLWFRKWVKRGSVLRRDQSLHSLTEKRVDWRSRRSQFFSWMTCRSDVNGRNVFDRDAWKAAGFDYRGVGR